MSKSKSLPCIMRVLRWAFTFLGLVLAVVTLTPLDAWWAKKLAGGWNNPQGDVLVVLGGSESSGDGIIAWDTYVRSLYAARAYREQGFPVIVVSGGGSRITVASSMREFLLSQGVPSSAVRVEDRSRSTRENAENVVKMLERMPGRKVLLTSDYHMYRALRCFRKAGLEVAARPVPDAFKRSGSLRGRWPAFLDLIAESMRIFYYWCRRWI
jgi:uncharacterized SAM-binding protein YcdF (DUF218 family)